LLRSPLVHFLLIGALLYALQSSRSSISEPIVVEVLRSEIMERLAAYQSQIGHQPNAVEAKAIENQVIDNALWLEQARALGLQKTDRVVRQRLVLNMRFLDASNDASNGASEDALFDRAISLGMDKSDTVVQRRLIDRVQAMIRAGVRSRTPDEAVLRTHYENTTERWREPGIVDLTHVYFSRDKRGDHAVTDALTTLSEFATKTIEPTDAVAFGDPFLSGHRVSGATPNRIVARFGPAFATEIEDQPTRRWVGPVASAFGIHLVWIHERIESEIPAFDAIRKRVLEDWFAQETRRALRAQIDRRRQVVEIRVVDDRAAPRARITKGDGASIQPPM
jgi:hypothetical protein